MICGECRFWSEMVAKAKLGRMLAVCLNTAGPHHGQYRDEDQCCISWKSGHDGAIDDPVKDPARYDKEDE